MLLRNYLWPVTISVLFHGAIIAFVVVGWESSTMPQSPVKMPQYIEAKLVELKPKAKQATSAKPKEVQKVDLTKKRREQEARERRAREKRAQEQKQLEQQRQQEAEEKRQQELAEQKLRAEREQQEERERQRRQAEAFEEALREEQGLILEDEYATEAQGYTQAIAQRIEQHWSRPSSARNNMQALLSIQLVPTGRVVSVAVVKSSGNAAFDRSAEQAVRQVEIFPEVKDMPPEVFERYYRQFNLLFKPQDLRQ